MKTTQKHPTPIVKHPHFRPRLCREIDNSGDFSYNIYNLGRSDPPFSRMTEKGGRDTYMRDLKYLSYFENLLQEANNELVAKAKAEGKVCVAYTCENVPEPLLNRFIVVVNSDDSELKFF